ncbi:MAG TPA: histidine triad nucleotide-binding protein [Bacteroidetes bacterium]|nr:histidine triad nucleotide-binding protein [Bacteroidota bacterium]
MDCLFCKIADGSIPSEVVHRDNDLVAFRDIRPQAPVHILIIPTRHIETVLDLKEEDNRLLGKMVMLANRLAKDEGIDEDGFRLVLNCKRHGGQEVYHIHLHLLGGRAMGWPPG